MQHHQYRHARDVSAVHGDLAHPLQLSQQAIPIPTCLLIALRPGVVPMSIAKLNLGGSSTRE